MACRSERGSRREERKAFRVIRFSSIMTCSDDNVAVVKLKKTDTEQQSARRDQHQEQMMMLMMEMMTMTMMMVIMMMMTITGETRDHFKQERGATLKTPKQLTREPYI